MTQTIRVLASDLKSSPAKTTQRILSIDALRGFDMFWLIGGDALFRSFDSVFHTGFTSWLATQFQHTAWAGPRFYDFIFPLFLFIVGLVTPVSISRMKSKGSSTTSIYLHILKRTATLVILGMITKGLFAGHVTIVSVLSRIGFCYMVAAILALHTSWRFQAILSAVILVLSWPLMMLIPIAKLDGHVYLMEGAAKFIPVLSQTCIWIMSIPSVLAGSLAGYWLFSNRPAPSKVLNLALAGLSCIAAGLAWGLLYPRVFSLWTGSFVVFMAGWSLLLLTIFYYIIDIRGFGSWSKFFVIIGSNAIFIYFLRVSGIFDFNKAASFFTSGIEPYCGQWAMTVHALAFVAILFSINAFLYSKKIFIKA